MSGRRRLQRLSAMALALVTAVFLAPQQARGVIAGPVTIGGLTSMTEGEFLDTFGVRTGEDFDGAKIRDGIKRVYLKGIFDDIRVSVGDGDRPTVAIDVIERDMVAWLRIEGEPQLSDRTIRDLFPLKIGQALWPEDLPAAIAALRSGLAAHGYPDAVVTARIDQTGRRHRVGVVLDVHAGRPLTIRAVDVRVALSSAVAAEHMAADIRGELRTAAGDVYDRIRLAGEMTRLRERLKREGYVHPVVGPEVYSDGVLVMPVMPGRMLTLTFEGNSALSLRTLRKEMPFFEVEDYTDEMVGEAIDRLLRLYHAEGFPFVQIAPVIDTSDDTVTVHFFINEGDRIRVSDVIFVGASLDHSRLRTVLALRQGESYNPDLLDRDRDSLREFYGALGYLEAAVRDIAVQVDRAARTALLTVTVIEGAQTLIGSVAVSGGVAEDAQYLLGVAGITPGAPYNEVDLSDARFRLLDHFTSRGYTAVDISIEREFRERRVAITFRVTEGRQMHFGNAVIVGNDKTRYEVIKRELIHRPGDLYSLRTIAEERQKLYKLGLFNDVEIEPIETSGGRRDLRIRVSEGNAGAVEFGFGYGDFEKFRGFGEVSYRNLWGWNRQVTLRAEASTLYNRILLQYNEPWFLGRPLPLRVFFLHENKEELNFSTKETLYKLNRYALTAGFEKKLNATTKGELYYEFSVVRTTDVHPDVILTKEDTGTHAISGIRPALVYDTRDNPFDPKKGMVAGLSVKLASLLLLSEESFVKCEIYDSHFFTLGRRFTLALSLRGGLAFGWGKSEQLPIIERFFLGGRSTVRGYAQDTLGPKGPDGNPTGGNAYLMGNIEMRTDVGRGLGLVPFVDFGNVWLRFKDIDPMSLKVTTGIGLRYATPVGPLRIDYGIKLRRETGESRGELHFSVGHAF